ncbi:MAG: NifB/NifX family molybdenum-iron cluster-binding protein [Ignavibacteriae bacterium]|nr:NifB/NifX family molybdenum-iron cluster-binding protein [Ignavibacteriota bacterium]
MKITCVSDDGKTISKHFGRAQYYVVLSIENNQVVTRETRDKLGHAHFAHDHHEPHQPGQQHGFDASSQQRHGQMLKNIQDCEVLLARGMGAGAYESIRRAGIRPYVTDVEDIDEAVHTYLDGQLIDHPERLH